MKLHDILSERNIVPIRKELESLPYVMKSNPDIWREILKRVAPNVKVLGTGGYGMALNLPGNKWVFKTWSNDYGYDAFIEFCQQHQSIHLPRFQNPRLLNQIRKNTLHESEFSSTFRLKDIDMRYAIVERLTKTSAANLLGKYLPYMAYLGYIGVTDSWQAHHAFLGLKDMVNIYPILEKYSIDSMIDLQRSNRAWAEVDAELKIPESWKTVSQELKKFKGTRSKIGWDIGGSNMMTRHGVLVYSDPFAGEVD